MAIAESPSPPSSPSSLSRAFAPSASAATGDSTATSMPSYSPAALSASSGNPSVPSGPSGAAESSASSKKRKADPSTPGRHSSQKVEVVDLTADTPPSRNKKYKSTPQSTGTKSPQSTGTKSPQSTRIKTPRPKTKTSTTENQTTLSPGNPAAEKRLRRWRSYAPQTFHSIRSRALTQRMYILDRHREAPISPTSPPSEKFTLAGTTGNVYTVHISHIPSCDCPHALKGNQCKHLIYVLARVLRVKEEWQYQLAFLSSELKEIFADASGFLDVEKEGKDGRRKKVEGECPICCDEFREGGGEEEEVVFCRAACGNNLHKLCFEKWAASKVAHGEVTCPFCRSPWEGEEGLLKGLVEKGKVGADGYINLAGQLGLSGQRDYSTYNDYFMRRQFGYSR